MLKPTPLLPSRSFVPGVTYFCIFYFQPVTQSPVYIKVFFCDELCFFLLFSAGNAIHFLYQSVFLPCVMFFFSFFSAPNAIHFFNQSVFCQESFFSIFSRKRMPLPILNCFLSRVLCLLSFFGQKSVPLYLHQSVMSKAPGKS